MELVAPALAPRPGATSRPRRRHGTLATCLALTPRADRMSMTFITGASSGIGRSLARRLAADGEAVVLVARRQSLLDSLAEEIVRAGGQALAIQCDVTDRASVRNAVRQGEARFGPTSRLIANAGGASPTAV